MAAAQFLPEFVHDGIDRDSWLDARRGGLGSSDAPGVLGISPFASPFEIAMQKLQKMPPTENYSELLKWGKFSEPATLAMFLDETKLKGTLSNQLFRSTVPDHEFMMATPDALIIEGDTVGGAELKMKLFHSKDWEINGIPDYVMTQAQHQLHVMRWPFIYVVVMLDGYRLRWERVEPNEEIMQTVVIPAERQFWDDIQHDRPIDPSLGAPDSAYRAIRHLHPDDNGNTIRLRGIDWQVRLAKWEKAKKQERSWKRVKEQQRNALMHAIGRNTYGQLDDGTQISLKTVPKTDERRSYRKLHKMSERAA